MEKTLDRALVWFRRDLRAVDQAALHHALRSARQVWCAFVFDRTILDPLPRADRRVEFIADAVAALEADLAALGRAHGTPGVRLLVRQGQAADEIVALAEALHVQAVFANHDDDPYALARDARVRGLLADRGVALHTSKDHVIFERGEVLTLSGKPYGVFTPYLNAWLRKIDDFYVKAYPIERHAGALAAAPADVDLPEISLARLGFVPTNLHELQVRAGTAEAEALLADFLERIDRYDTARDFPALRGPSYLSVHLRFGTISIRRLAAAAREHIAAAGTRGSRGASVWLSELAWRDFYQQVLHHHPHVVGASCNPEFDRVRFEHGRHADEAFAAWCEGRTGYPLVDAAMLQLQQTGWMHNRLRMVAASFLVKDLGIDWRRGEAHFALHLIDYELASNNGGWQWVASTGCDAQPWFRLFNPVTQSRRFDPEGKFIRRYLPQLGRLGDDIHAPWQASPIELEAAGVELGRHYPRPIVDHAEAREKTLQRYSVVKAAVKAARA
ncbi:MAG TPA: deoxyribodipyrimidine photo-lyase [Caldimonas sp.]|jgi:deoxyribodipyrimidine photo-lyase|nr:deoxyribodipyrimidine photo-lyase [Caldimonas sp.]HEX2540867.1 deoxyribodipyrimidine photo-lyase [Caldimonas sp.]